MREEKKVTSMLVRFIFLVVIMLMMGMTNMMICFVWLMIVLMVNSSLFDGAMMMMGDNTMSQRQRVGDQH